MLCYTYIVTYTVKKMVFGGSCLSNINGKTVFIENCLPDEVVEIEILQEKKDYYKAKATNIINKSIYRQDAICPVFNECGGCNLQFAQYDYQLELKKNIILDCFTRNRVEYTGDINVVAYKNTEYRNRFQFSRGGLMSKSTNDVVALNDCPCAVKEIRSFLKSAESNILKKYDRLQVFATGNTTNDDTNESVVLGIEGESQVTLKLLSKCITFDIRGFFQSNVEMLKKTIPLIVDNLAGENLLDMYSGVGTLSLYAKHAFKTVTLVEHNRHAMAFAKQNYSNDNYSSIFAHSMTGEQWVKKAKKIRYDALIIDPPRSGIEKIVRAWICNSGIESIRYLSCDISTLARDTKFFLDAGYTIRKFYLLDFYPNTSHIESLVHFEYNPTTVTVSNES